MKIVLSLLVIVLIPFMVISGEQTCSKESREKDAQCGTYCLQVVKPLLNYASSVKSKEEQFAELEDKISEQKVQLASQINLTASCERNIASKDALIANLRSQINEKASLKETLKQKELQLAQLIEFTVSYKNNIASKDAAIANLQSQSDEKDKKIDKLKKDLELNAAKINQLESKLAKYEAIPFPSSCINKSTDLHWIKVPDTDPFSVPCDSQIDGGGWTVIQRRMDGSVDFYRNWEEYKEGFGDLRGEFFLGLEKLHLLTKSQTHELYIYMKDTENETLYAKYSHFVIGNETESYMIKSLGDYSGDAGNAMAFHLNMKFSTKDRDNDKWVGVNCARNWNSGWWFKDCAECILNGPYKNYKLKAWHSYSLTFAQMMIRPRLN